MRGENVSGVDSVDQSLFEDLHELEKFAPHERQLKVFRASREFETVRESEVRLVRRLYVHVLSVVDRAESSSETVQLVVGQKLLVEVVITGSLTVLTFMVLGDSLLLVLYRGLLRTILELHLKKCRCMART